MRRVKGQLAIILSVAAATGATVAFASTTPAQPSGRPASEPPLEQTLDYSETIPGLSASKFAATPENDQTQTASAQSSQTNQSAPASRTTVDKVGYRTEVTETENPDTAQKIAGFVRIRAPTTSLPAKTE